MSDAYYVSIAFSKSLLSEPSATRQEALKDLNAIFQTHPDIRTCRSAYAPNKSARVSGESLSESFKGPIVKAKLGSSELQNVRQLGFSVRHIGPQGFTTYP